MKIEHDFIKKKRTKRLSLKDAKVEGAKYYWTGIPCPKGHIYYRHVKGNVCDKCETDKSVRRNKLRSGTSKMLDIDQLREKIVMNKLVKSLRPQA